MGPTIRQSVSASLLVTCLVSFQLFYLLDAEDGPRPTVSISNVGSGPRAGLSPYPQDPILRSKRGFHYDYEDDDPDADDDDEEEPIGPIALPLSRDARFPIVTLEPEKPDAGRLKERKDPSRRRNEKLSSFNAGQEPEVTSPTTSPMPRAGSISSPTFSPTFHKVRHAFRKLSSANEHLDPSIVERILNTDLFGEPSAEEEEEEDAKEKSRFNYQHNKVNQHQQREGAGKYQQQQQHHPETEAPPSALDGTQKPFLPFLTSPQPPSNHPPVPREPNEGETLPQQDNRQDRTGSLHHPEEEEQKEEKTDDRTKTRKQESDAGSNYRGLGSNFGHWSHTDNPSHRPASSPSSPVVITKPGATCYKTDEILIVIAITCCLNFAFVLLIWGCVRWFSSSKESADFRTLECEEEATIWEEEEDWREYEDDVDGEEEEEDEEEGRVGMEYGRNHVHDQDCPHNNCNSNSLRHCESCSLSNNTSSQQLYLSLSRNCEDLLLGRECKRGSRNSRELLCNTNSSSNRPSEKYHFSRQKLYQRNLREFGLLGSAEKEKEGGAISRAGNKEIVVGEEKFSLYSLRELSDVPLRRLLMEQGEFEQRAKSASHNRLVSLSMEDLRFVNS